LVGRKLGFNVFACAHISTYWEYYARIIQGDDVDDFKAYDSRGLWLKASAINHSCVQNCVRQLIGDFLILRATCDIPINTELLLGYAGFTDDHAKKNEELQRRGFECTCAICEESKNAGRKILEERKAMFHDLQQSLSSAVDDLDLEQVGRQLLQYERTYKKPGSEVPRIMILPIYLLLAAVLRERQLPTIIYVATVLKGLESVGFVIEGADLSSTDNGSFEVKKWGEFTPNVPEAWMALCIAYKVSAPHLLKKAEGYAKLAFSMQFGDDVGFGKLYNLYQGGVYGGKAA
jgi:hypothetical protein